MKYRVSVAKPFDFTYNLNCKSFLTVCFKTQTVLFPETVTGSIRKSCKRRASVEKDGLFLGCKILWTQSNHLLQ